MGRIAIVAMGPSADRYFRVAELSGNTSFLFDEVWSINGFGHVFACDRVFHMDDVRLQALRAKAGNQKINHMLAWLQATKIPVITSRVLPKEPNNARLLELAKIIPVMQSGADETEKLIRERETLEIEKELVTSGGFESLVAFPLEDVMNRFHVHPYFNSTVAYAIAMGALEGHHMTIYGADFDYPGNVQSGHNVVERGRGCCEYWIGIAVSHGCTVNICGESTLLDANIGGPLYGYDGIDMEAGIDDATGMIKVTFQDIPLPSAKDIERRYYKGPPGQFDARHAASNFTPGEIRAA